MKVGCVGKRSLCNLSGLRSVSGVQPHLFFDPSPSARQMATEAGLEIAETWEALLEGSDAVSLGTPMHLHAAQAVEALSDGKHVLSEVTAAVTLEECYALEKAAKSGPVYFFAENYCYFKQNIIALHLAREGRFGDVYYGEGDYVHEVRFLHRQPDGKPTWRMEDQVGKRGNTYCTHELGPLMQWFRAIDPTIRIESVACFGTGAHTDPTLHHDDCTLTLVRLSNGGLLKLRLDMVSNRPERIAYALQGVTGALEFEHDDHRIWIGENRTVSWDDPSPRRWQQIADFESVLPSELANEMTAAADAGHGGADYLVGRRFAQAITGQRAPEIGFRDAIEWTVVGLLSQQSIVENGAVMPMPSFVYE